MALHGVDLLPETRIKTPAGESLLRPGQPDDNHRFLVESLRASDRAEPEQELDNWDDRARRYLHHGVAVAAQYPESVTAQLNIVQLAIQAGDRDRATEAAHRALELLTSRASDGAYLNTVAPGVLLGALRGGQALGRFESYLRSLPASSASRVPLANLLIDNGDLAGASECLAELSKVNTSAGVLRAYCLMQLAQNREAISLLRSVLRRDPDEADAAMLLALAFLSEGATKRALHYARRSARLAPARKDIGLQYLQLLLDMGDTEAVAVEISSLKDRGVTDSLDLTLIQARSAVARRNPERAIAFLRKAQAEAERDGLTQTALEIRTQLSLIRTPDRRVDRVRTVTAARRTAPQSVSLINMLADSLMKTSEAPTLRSALADVAVDPGLDHPDLFPARITMAHLELDFESALRLAKEWERAQPLNGSPPAVALMLHGQLNEDWEASAQIGRTALRRTHFANSLINNAAYAFALSGSVREARDTLTRYSGSETYHLAATRGLVEIASGNVLEGLRLYRKAAMAADDDPEQLGRTAMTLHQHMALRRLGVDTRESLQVAASALPEVVLPIGWMESPALVLLHRVASRQGWNWPDILP